ncbi:hypothetical protein C8J57DRAFT_1628909 [Mycena rebaudengoi]|nr:hypothetical protein C8J57DRAFT_1628909 [Mycena rebaudengoi]
MKATHSLIFISSILLASGMPLGQATESLLVTPEIVGSASESATLVDAVQPSQSDTAYTSSLGPTGSDATTLNALAIDNTTGTLVGYDSTGKYLGEITPAAKGSIANGAVASAASAPGETCRDATSEEISSIPGWGKFMAYATSQGGGQTPQKEWVNSEDRHDVWAYICYSTARVQLSADGDPVCNTHTSDALGTVQGIGGNLSQKTTVTMGETLSYTSVTEDTSSFAWTGSMSVEADVPGLAKATAETSITLSLENKIGSQVQDQKDMTSTHEDEWEVAVGTSCKVTVCAAPECKRRILIPEQQQELTDCTSKANGRVDVYLKGWIWASYHASWRDQGCIQSLTAPGAPCAGVRSAHNDLNHCFDNNKCYAHSNWAFTIESVLPDMADRSHPMQFSNSFSSQSRSDVTKDCQAAPAK